MGVARDLSGRRVLVTGASSGIGAATCRAIVGDGGSVAMLARRKERLEELAEELGVRASVVCCDVTDLNSLESSVNEVADLLGGLDGVVAVAGRMMAGEISSGTPERWRELFDLNLVGPLATVRYATARFPRSGRRDVVIVGSTGALTPMPSAGIYAASKRGIGGGLRQPSPRVGAARRQRQSRHAGHVRDRGFELGGSRYRRGGHRHGRANVRGRCRSRTS